MWKYMWTYGQLKSLDYYRKRDLPIKNGDLINESWWEWYGLDQMGGFKLNLWQFYWESDD